MVRGDQKRLSVFEKRSRTSIDPHGLWMPTSKCPEKFNCIFTLGNLTIVFLNPLRNALNLPH